MSGSATENSILLSVLPRLNKNFNQSINQILLEGKQWTFPFFPFTYACEMSFPQIFYKLLHFVFHLKSCDDI